MADSTQIRARILVADEHAMLRELAEQFLADHHDVVPGVGTIPELDSAFALGGFDVAFLNVSWGASGGILPHIPRLRERQPGVKMLALSPYNDWSVCQAVLSAGMDGFLVKQAHPSELLRGISAVVAGGRYLSGSMASESARNGQKRTRKISKLEHRILLCLAEGMTCRQVAEILCMQPKAVRYHMTQLRRAYAISAETTFPWPEILVVLQAGDVEP